MLSVFKEVLLSWDLGVLTTSCPKAAVFISKAPLLPAVLLFGPMCIHSLFKLNYNYFVYLSQKFEEKKKDFPLYDFFSLPNKTVFQMFCPIGTFLHFSSFSCLSHLAVHLIFSIISSTEGASGYSLTKAPKGVKVASKFQLSPPPPSSCSKQEMIEVFGLMMF